MNIENITASQYFNDNWQTYQDTIRNNILFHQEVTATLNTFLEKYFQTTPFSFVDVGCGDGSTIVNILKKYPLKQYIGIDAAPDILKLAEKNIQQINCEKTFICEHMLEAVKKLPSTYNIIYTSYALHHLSLQQKREFIQTSKDKLAANGYFIMVDVILKPQQTREEWLNALAERIKQTTNLTDAQIAEKMRHPATDDHPEENATFAAIAREQRWQQFDIIFEKGNCVFQLYKK